jgi:FkbM family methyltransferase
VVAPPVTHLLIITPSRGRPDRLQTMADSVHAHKAGEVRIVACVDDDDPALPAYRQVTGVKLRVGPRQGLVGWTNTVAVEAVRSADPPAYLASFGDDHVVHSPGFDRALAAALDALAPVGFAYGNDLHRGEHLPTACAMTATVVQVLGYMAPPALEHLYCDQWWRKIGRRLDRIAYLPDVVIEHAHYRTGKASKDDGYARVNSARQYARDRRAFELYINSGRLRRDVATLRLLAQGGVVPAVQPWTSALPAFLTAAGIELRGVVQVGAHRGQEVGLWAQLGADPIVLIEPIPALADGLRRHEGVTVIEAACGATTGRKVLHLTENTKHSSLYEPTRKPVTGRIEVDVRALADVIDERVNVAVVDVQGAELDVVAGAPLDRLDLVVLETRTKARYDGAPLHDDVVQAMAGRGWEVAAEWWHDPRGRLRDVAFTKAPR